jgi:hypothetical protein
MTWFQFLRPALRQPDEMYYQQLVSQYQQAMASWEIGIGDDELLWLQFDAARRALDVFLQSCAQSRTLPANRFPDLSSTSLPSGGELR